MPFEEVDIFRTPLTAEQIRALAGERPIAELFSWKSPQARSRGLRPGVESDEALLELMAAEPRLIRRPLVRIGSEVIIGAELDRIRALVEARTS